MGWSSSRTPDWRRFLHLPGSERRDLVTAAVLLPPVTVLLKSIGYQRSQRWLGRLSPPPSIAGDLPGARNLGRLVTIAGRRHLAPSTCLSRSLVLWVLLRRRGIDAEIRLGVRKDGAEVKVHAWVEYLGVPLNDADDVAQQFSAFPPAAH
jgi:hypothetical protein